jgi:hypothetical protein
MSEPVRVYLLVEMTREELKARIRGLGEVCAMRSTPDQPLAETVSLDERLKQAEVEDAELIARSFCFFDEEDDNV